MMTNQNHETKSRPSKIMFLNQDRLQNVCQINQYDIDKKRKDVYLFKLINQAPMQTLQDKIFINP